MRSASAISFNSITVPSGTMPPAPLRVFNCATSDGMRAKRSIRLGDHLVGSAEIIEIIDVIAAQVNLQGLENIGDGHICLLRFDAIDIRIKLRNARAEGAEQGGDAAGLCALRRSVPRGGFQLLRRRKSGAIFHLHLESTRLADACAPAAATAPGENASWTWLNAPIKCRRVPWPIRAGLPLAFIETCPAGKRSSPRWFDWCR